MTTATTAVVVTSTLSCVANAEAHFLYHHKHMTLEAKINYFERSKQHDIDAIDWLKNQQLKKHDKHPSKRAVKKELRFHHQALRWYTNLYNHYKARWNRLHPVYVPTVTTSSGYWLWECIHSHEGNDSSGTYTGYLQMTNPWEGHSISGSWASMGTGVYQIAQQEYVEHGFSRSWLYGQWPNTAPRCI